MKPGDLFRTRCDTPPPLVEWDDEPWDATDVTVTLPPGVPVLLLRWRPGWRRCCVLVGGRAGWVWAHDLEPL